jgi:hypothetical protein
MIEKMVMIVDRDSNQRGVMIVNRDVLLIGQRNNKQKGVMIVNRDVLLIGQRNNKQKGVMIVNRDVLSIYQRTNNHGDVGSMCQRTKTHQRRFIMVVHRDLMSMRQRNNHRKWFIVVHNVSDQHGENRLFDLPEGQAGHLKVELNQIHPL